MSDALKMHLRVLELQRTALRVVTLRPQTGVRFSSNYYHDTWHILGGADGAQLLGRLLWGLSFCDKPGTLILIDREHLAPTPFEADPPDPILIIPSHLTRFDPELLRALKLRWRRAPGPPKTIRWHTFSMDAALADDARHHHRRPHDEADYDRERVSRTAGFLCFAAPRDVLRAHAIGIHGMHRHGGYYPIARQRGHWHYDGEFQVIDNFYRDISAAKIARHDVVGEEPKLVADDDRWEIYRRKERVLALRDERRRRRRDQVAAERDRLGE